MSSTMPMRNQGTKRAYSTGVHRLSTRLGQRTSTKTSPRWTLVTTSNYPEYHPFYSIYHKKTLGRMKNEYGREMIAKNVVLNPNKYYAIQTDSGLEEKKC